MYGERARYGGVAIAFAAALLAGCGGGGGGQQQGQGQEPPAPAAPPPPPPEQGQGGDQAQIDAAAKQEMQGKLDQLLQQRPITFEPDSTQLTQQGQQTVSEVSKMITESPGQLRFEVGGYTAPGPGEPGSNAQQLSQERAQKVVDQMAQQGVPAERLEAKAYGDAPSGDPEASRRVDIKIL